MLRVLLATVSTAFLVAGCDQVRLPGSELPETEVIAATDSADQPNPESERAKPSTAIETIDEPSETGSSIIAIGDLSEINATRCGLTFDPSQESLTVAEITGAESKSEDLVGAATINGNAAALVDFPGLVKMEPRKIRSDASIVSGHCSATRISENWFVTAAHCLDDEYDEVTFVVLSETLSSPLAKRVRASSSVCHAAFEGSANQFVNDVALVRVSAEVLPDIVGVPVASFGTTDDSLLPFNYTEARMAGWGLTSFGGTLSDTLMSATLSVTSTGPAAIRVTSQNGAGPCVGDSGGPLYISENSGDPVVVGVLSVVEQNRETQAFCEGQYGARYTNLQGYQGWIDRVIAACEGQPELCGS